MSKGVKRRMVFVEKVGDLLERHVAIENRKPIFIWGVSEMFGLSRPECIMRALALAPLQQARDHFARLASKSEHSQHRHYGLVAFAMDTARPSGRWGRRPSPGPMCLECWLEWFFFSRVFLSLLRCIGHGKTTPISERHTRVTRPESPIHALVDSTHNALKDGGLRMDND
jgi:hypothetical protein